MMDPPGGWGAEVCSLSVQGPLFACAAILEYIEHGVNQEHFKVLSQITFYLLPHGCMYI